MRLLTILLATVLLAACAGSNVSALRPGEARFDDVQASMGAPAMRWQDGDGSVQLAYPHGPAGFTTLMVKLGPDGRVQSIANVLEENSFVRIRAGMTKDEVLRVLGPSDAGETVYYKARDELVWDWRFCQVSGSAGRFMVLFDGTSGRVRSSMAVPEPSGFSGPPPCSR